VHCETQKNNCVGPAVQNKRRGMLTYGAVLLHDNARSCTAARTRALLEHFNWEFLITLLTALISLRATTACLSTWRTGCDHSTSTKWGVGGRCKTGLSSQVADFFDTGIQKLIPNTTSVSVPAVTTLRSCLSMYVFFTYNFFSHCLFCWQLTGGFFPNKVKLSL
jgi:hypothetical protein